MKITTLNLLGSFPKPCWQVTNTISLTSMLIILFQPLHAQEALPSWWFDGTPPVIISGGTENNQGAANIAQAKWIVSEALRGLETADPTTAAQVGSDLEGTAADNSDRIIDLTVPDPKSTAWIEQQKSALTLGQLKAIALPFYNRLNVLDADWVKSQLDLNHGGTATLNEHYWQVSSNTHYTEAGYYPWNPETSAEINKSVATIGQLKAVFALRFNTLDQDIDDDELLDSWEQLIVDFDENDAITSIFEVLANDDYDEDGASNEDEFLAGTDATDPTDFPAGSIEIPDTGDLVLLRISTPLL
ncbi:MAG: hypothetical protein ACSHX0_09900 [Akkermansiaceae bacterium]